MADLDAVTAGSWHFRQLFVNGERRPRTRLPRDGYFWIEDVPGFDLRASQNDEFIHGHDRFVAREGDVARWRNLSDVDVVVHHYWVEERLPMASFDEDTRVVTSSRRSIFVLRDDVGQRYAKYYVENVFEALSEPGEWYLDRSRGPPVLPAAAGRVPGRRGDLRAGMRAAPAAARHAGTPGRGRALRRPDLRVLRLEPARPRIAGGASRSVTT